MAISQDYQIEYTNPDGNSILIGAETDYDLTELRGFGMPDVRANDINRLDTDGFISSRVELLEGRNISFRVVIYGAPGDTLDTNVTNFSKAFQLSDTPGTLQFRFPGPGLGTADTTNDERFVKCYVRRVTKQILARNSSGRIPVFVSLQCPNPIINGAEQHSEDLSLSSFTGGATFNATFNLSFGAGSSAATVCTNAGNFPQNPVVKFNGPATDPKLTNNTSGEHIELKGLTLAAGEYCDVDFYDRSVLKGGSTSVYNYVTSDSTWWNLKPGDNSLTFSAASSSATTCNVKWYDAWI